MSNAVIVIIAICITAVLMHAIDNFKIVRLAKIQLQQDQLKASLRE